MPRPKANTPAGRRATEKWRKTMLEKYGSEEAFKHAIRCMGSLGGRATGHKGFATNPELAKRAGSKGGKISRRTSAPAEPKVYYYEDERTIYSEPKTIKPKVSDPEPKNASSNVWLSWFRRNKK